MDRRDRHCGIEGRRQYRSGYQRKKPRKDPDCVCLGRYNSQFVEWLDPMTRERNDVVKSEFKKPNQYASRESRLKAAGSGRRKFHQPSVRKSGSCLLEYQSILFGDLKAKHVRLAESVQHTELILDLKLKVRVSGVHHVSHVASRLPGVIESVDGAQI